MQIQLGNFAECIAGIGTVAAFAVTYLLLRRESVERVRQQARLVSTWVTDVIEVRLDEAMATDLVVHFRARNGSDEPIYNVAVFARVRNRWGLDEGPKRWRVPVLRPSHEENAGLVVMHRDHAETLMDLTCCGDVPAIRSSSFRT